MDFGNLMNSFLAFHLNGLYAIVYFLKHNFLLFPVLFAIGYLVYGEMETISGQFVHDYRRMI